MNALAILAGLLFFDVEPLAPTRCPIPRAEIQRCELTQTLAPLQPDPFSSKGVIWLCMHIWPDGQERFVRCFWQPEP